MNAVLGRPVLYRDSGGIDYAAIISGVNGDGSAELWLIPRPGYRGQHATPIRYSAAGEPNTWRELPGEERPVIDRWRRSPLFYIAAALALLGALMLVEFLAG